MPRRPLSFESLEPRTTLDASSTLSLALPDEVRDLVAEALTMSAPETGWHTPNASDVVDTELSSSARLLSLRGADGLVRGVHATVIPAAPAVIMTAHVFRGNDEVATQTLAADGAFSYENDAGITDVVFTPSSKTRVTISNIETSAMAGMPNASNDPLSNFSSRAYAIAGAPVVPLPSNLSLAVKNLNLTGSPNGSGEKRFYAQRDPGQYTLFRITYTKGSGNIAWVGTIMKTGVDYMNRETVTTSGFPEGYMLRIDANTVVIAPGAPSLISFAGGFSGATGRLNMVEGATLESVLPPAVMNATTVDSSILRMDPQFQEEGIFPGMTEIQESSSPVFSSPGHQANVWYQIKNDALNGGAIGLDVYVGWYAGEPTRGTLQRRYDTSMAGGQLMKLSVNVTAPSRPSDATSDRPIISLVMRFAGGQTEVTSKLGKEPQSKDVRVITNDENGHPVIRFESQTYTAQEQARIRELTDRALNALLTSPDARLQTIRTVFGDDKIITMLAQDTDTAMNESTTDAAIAEMTESHELTTNIVHEDAINVAYLSMAGNTTIGQSDIIHESFGSIQQRSDDIGQILAGGIRNHVQRFELTQDSMVNVWLSSVNGMNLHLYKDGEELFPGKTNDDITSGRSISARMPAGHYEVRVTTQPSMFLPSLQNVIHSNPQSTLHVEIAPAASSIITGRISREGSENVHSISFRKFQLDASNQVEHNESLITDIRTDVPTWIVVHGRTDDSKSGKMEYLASSLWKRGFQVIMVDWQNAANDVSLPFEPLRDALWTPAAGSWIANQLKSLGFQLEDLNIAGHSHGTYVSYFAALNLKSNGERIQNIVALDPAKDPIFIGQFQESDVVFNDVADRSIAIKGSIDAAAQLEALQSGSMAPPIYFGSTMIGAGAVLPIEFGDDNLTKTARVSYEVRTGSIDPFAVHEHAITAFAELIERGVALPGMPSLFGEAQTVALDPNGYEGTIFAIDIDTMFDAKRIRKALPYLLPLINSSSVPL